MPVGCLVDGLIPRDCRDDERVDHTTKVPLRELRDHS